MKTEELLTGVMVNYYFICKTKLWLFSRGMGQEEESELVKLGRLLHQKLYGREEKDVKIDRIAIDFVKKGDTIEIHEIKKRSSSEEADTWQVKYYIHVLKGYGLKVKGFIHYINEHRVVGVEDDEGIEKVLKEVESVVEKDTPPLPERKSYCKKCSYRDFCWV